jgi:predicted esterase
MSNSIAPRVLVAAALAFAAVLSPTVARADGETCAPNAKKQAEELESEIGELFAAGKYEEAAEKCRAEIALVPEQFGPQYNLACALARLGKKDDALAALTKSVELGFEDPEHMKVDEDLANVRDEKPFADLVAKAVENDKKAEAGTYDPGIAVPGVKAIDRAPEGGLRYRLLVPEGAAAKPRRLLVWLHPSGGSMNDLIAGHSPGWMKQGYAVLVPTQKRWRGWTDADAKRLVEKTLPDAATIDGVDAKRPVLMGFSAGGQMALELWRKDPSRFGGLVLDAAYPLDAEAYARGERKTVEPPAGDAVKSVPVFVLVGLADGGHKLWKDAEEPWTKAGVPLTVKYVPDGKHEWLLRAELLLEFEKWLADVAAGKLPGAAPTPAPAAAPTSR